MNGNPGVHGMQHWDAIISQSMLACQGSACEAVDTRTVFNWTFAGLCCS